MSEIAVVGRRKIHVVGGGTISPVREHMALAAPAYGNTARRLAELCSTFWTAAEVDLHLTKMADSSSELETTQDLGELALTIVRDFKSKVVFWSPAVCDLEGSIGSIPSGKHAERLDSSQTHQMDLQTADKIVPIFRRESVDGMKPRKDIFLSAFKTTAGATEEEQYSAGLKLCKQASANLVLANDTKTRLNMVITPEEAAYHVTTDRETALRGLAEMAHLRANLTFTESTVVGGETVAWDSPEIYPNLKTVVNHCIDAGAYKPFLGVTAGHFAAKVAENEFLTSIRKTNFNALSSTGLVKVITDGPDKVVAIGAKPSVGGQSQRIVFEDHPEADCIVHFHCPPLDGSKVPVVSQYEYECGSHQCGENTSRGLELMEEDGIKAVYLDKHGPNIVFHHSVPAERVIRFIDQNFDLQAKTGGYVPTS